MKLSIESFAALGETAPARGAAPWPDPGILGAAYLPTCSEPGCGFNAARRRARAEEERGPVPASGVVRYVTFGGGVELASTPPPGTGRRTRDP